MRCCDCKFRNDCADVENDLVSFALCGTRIGKLADEGLKAKLDAIKLEDEKAEAESVHGAVGLMGRSRHEHNT